MIALLLAVALQADGGAPPGTLVDRVIAVVDNEVITHSELLIEARVALALREGGEAASRDLAPELLTALLDYLVNQVLVASQARRSGVPLVAEHAVNGRVRQLQQRFRSQTAYDAFLRRFGISEAAIRRILRRDLQNQRFIDKQMRSRLLVLGSEHGNRQARYNHALKRWLEEQRDSVEIRLLGPDDQLERQ